MSDLLEAVRFNQDGLVAAVVQDRVSGRVLMQAWMDADAVKRTQDSGLATFWSRSRGQPWVKGETSGNTQAVREIRLDCDGDCLLLLVDPAGPACHTGEISCFYNRLEDSRWVREDPAETGLLRRLSEVLEERKGASPETSYVASLYAQGREKILRKLGEEAIETILAGQTHAAQAPGESADELVHEVADLWFHSLVLLADAGLSAQDVMNKLAARLGISGLDEKAARNVRAAGED